jgi:polyketide biosynthesis acyl carrier protein
MTRLFIRSWSARRAARDFKTLEGECMNKEEIVAIIARHAREVIPGLQGHSFQATDALKDLGANSIDRSEIVMMTLESLSLNIPLIEIARAGNIGELASILHAKL